MRLKMYLYIVFSYIDNNILNITQFPKFYESVFIQYTCMYHNYSETVICPFLSEQ